VSLASNHFSGRVQRRLPDFGHSRAGTDFELYPHHRGGAGKPHPRQSVSGIVQLALRQQQLLQHHPDRLTVRHPDQQLARPSEERWCGSTRCGNSCQRLRSWACACRFHQHLRSEFIGSLQDGRGGNQRLRSECGRKVPPNPRVQVRHQQERSSGSLSEHRDAVRLG